MRNRYPGTCYRCGLLVEAGDGHFERFRGAWRTQHATCAIEHRGMPDPDRESYILSRAVQRVAGTGKRAQRARKLLRDNVTQGATK